VVSYISVTNEEGRGGARSDTAACEIGSLITLNANHTDHTLVKSILLQPPPTLYTEGQAGQRDCQSVKRE
jgi:hypothetical protein